MSRYKRSVCVIVKWPRNKTCSICDKKFATPESKKKHEQWTTEHGRIWHGVARDGTRISCGDCVHDDAGTCDIKKRKPHGNKGCYEYDRNDHKKTRATKRRRDL
jgi:hypothetical protein